MASAGSNRNLNVGAAQVARDLLDKIDKQTGETALHDAVRKLDVQKVGWLLENGANPNIKAEVHMEFTPLHLLAKISFSSKDEKDSIDKIRKIFSILMKYNVDATIPDLMNDVPLFYFAISSPPLLSNDALSILIKKTSENDIKKIIFSIPNAEMLNLFLLACDESYLKFSITELLPNYVEHNTDNLNYLFVILQHLKRLKDIDVKKLLESSFFESANNIDVFKMILPYFKKYNVDANIINIFGRTVLAHLVYSLSSPPRNKVKDITIVKLLIDAGAKDVICNFGLGRKILISEYMLTPYANRTIDKEIFAVLMEHFQKTKLDSANDNKLNTPTLKIFDQSKKDNKLSNLLDIETERKNKRDEDKEVTTDKKIDRSSSPKRK